MRLLFLTLPLALGAVSAVHCAGGGDGPVTPPIEETSIPQETGDAQPDAAMEAPPPDTAMDVRPDAPTVACTKPPVFSTPMRLNHSPDSLRRVANAGMVLLGDGRIMIAMLEALDTGSRSAVWARIVDPTTGTITPDERLDVDADGLTDGSAFQIASISGRAVSVRYGGAHLRVYSKGRWSPDLSSVMPITAADDLGWLAAPSGEVLVTDARAASPSGQAIVFRPDEGGAKGSWSSVQALDLAGSSGRPRIDSMLLPDGRFLTMVWQGAGGPAIRQRSLSGSWSTPSPKAEIGATDASPQYRLLDDGTIVLTALEGSTDTRRVVTSTWNAVDNWTTTRLLSKLPGDINGVVPASPGPFLFSVSGSEVEFVSWIAGCASPAKDCEFNAISRRYSGGTWKDPQLLTVGASRTGPDGTMVIALDGSTPLVARLNVGRTNFDLRVRSGTGDYAPSMQLVKASPLFSAAIQIDARFYGSASALWTLTRRETTTMGTTTQLATALGKINAVAGTVEWAPVTAGAFEMRTFGEIYPYVDGASGFTVGVASATDGTMNAPILAHSNGSAITVEGTSVIASDERSASFVNVPRTAPRPDRDVSAMYMIAAKPSDTTTRLRAYAYDGIGGGVPKVLANETRNPRAFADGMLLFGCGGAFLYAADASETSHTLELVLVREPEPADGG